MADINFPFTISGGLFQRVVTRTIRWSQDGGGQNPYFLYKQVVRFYLDVEHDFVLEMSARKYSRIRVSRYSSFLCPPPPWMVMGIMCFSCPSVCNRLLYVEKYVRKLTLKKGIYPFDISRAWHKTGPSLFFRTFQESKKNWIFIKLAGV